MPTPHGPCPGILPNRDTFERALSRRLDELRAELLGLHAQEVQRARQDTAPAPPDMRHREPDARLAEVGPSQEVQQARVLDPVGRSQWMQRARRDTPSAPLSIGHREPAAMHDEDGAVATSSLPGPEAERQSPVGRLQEVQRARGDTPSAPLSIGHREPAAMQDEDGAVAMYSLPGPEAERQSEVGRSQDMLRARGDTPSAPLSKGHREPAAMQDEDGAVATCSLPVGQLQSRQKARRYTQSAPLSIGHWEPTAMHDEDGAVAIYSLPRSEGELVVRADSSSPVGSPLFSSSSTRHAGPLFVMHKRWQSKLELVRRWDWHGLEVCADNAFDRTGSLKSYGSSVVMMFKCPAGVWGLLRVVMLWLDLVCVPLDIGVGPISTFAYRVFLLLGRCFWSVDALAELWVARQSCGRTRDFRGSLLVMIIALALECPALLMEPSGWEYLLHAGRILRLSLLMCADVKDSILTLDAMELTLFPASAAFLSEAPHRCFYTAVGAHWVACLWARDVGGSAEKEWHLGAGRLHVLEGLFPMLAALLIACIIIAQTTAHLLSLEKASTLRMQRQVNDFIRRQAIPRTTAIRMKQSLQLSTRAVVQRFQEEEEMLKHFPDSLRRDVLVEVRVAVVDGMQYFVDIQQESMHGVIRDVACNAIVSKLQLEREILFAEGDAAPHMYFVEAGSLAYRAGPSSALPLSPSCRHSSRLVRKDWVSEPALWMDWRYAGGCVALSDTIVLALSGGQLFDVLSERQAALWHAVKYAKRFVAILNERASEETIDDLVMIPGTFSDLVQASPSNARDHFVFISHFKAEAGTEASLMQAELQLLLQNEPSDPANDMVCPVFLDSENLTDLRSLREHVQRSSNLVLLLTPGVLSRPWCVLEIVTAINTGVPIVLVRVERPGFKFEYPSDAFYTALRQGNIFNQEAEDMLKSEGLQMSGVETILRQVFMHVAVPFSPHRTFSVRQAELADVLKRCQR